MRIPLRSARSILLFPLAILLFATVFIFAVTELWLADRYGRSSNPQDWARATKWESQNPEYWRQLGVYEEWDIDRGNLTQAASDLERAVEIDPWSSTDWMELANIDEALGKTKAAAAAYERAMWAYSVSPEVAWQFGGFLLRQHDFESASVYIRRALVENPNLTVPALSLCLRMGQPVSSIFDGVLPAQSAYYLTALDYFVSQKKTDAALETWSRLLHLATPLQMSSSFPLIHGLIREGETAAASRIWRQALRKSNWPADAAQLGSLVFNGSFEHDILNGGFDWSELQTPGAAFALDASVAHTGTHSMRITFDGSSNLNFQNLSELVPVEPGRHYHFSAYLRTRGITTDSGMGFIVFDPLHSAAPQASTPILIGTHPWTLVETDFVASTETSLIEITLARKPSSKFDNKLSGTVWVDDVSLTPLGASKKRVSP